MLAHLTGSLTYPHLAALNSAHAAALRFTRVPASAWKVRRQTLSVRARFTITAADYDPDARPRPWRIPPWSEPLRAIATGAEQGTLEVRFEEPAERDLRFYPGGYPSWPHECDTPVEAFDRETYVPPGIANEASPFVAVALSPDGKLCAVAGGDHFSGRVTRIERCAVLLLDPTTGTELSRLHGHQDIVTSLAFSADGATLAVGDSGQGLRTYDVKTVRTTSARKPTIHRYEPQMGPRMKRILSEVSAVCFASDGRLLSAGGTKVGVWEGTQAKPRRTLAWNDQQLTQVAASPKGRLLAAIEIPSQFGNLTPLYTSGALVVWDLDQPEPLDSRPGLFVDALFSPDGALAVLEAELGRESLFDSNLRLIPFGSDAYRKRLQFLDPDTRKPRWTVEVEGHPQRLTFSPDGKTLYGAGVERDRLVLRGWITKTGRAGRARVHPFRSPEGLCTGVAASADVVAAVTEDAVRLFR